MNIRDFQNKLEEDKLRIDVPFSLIEHDDIEHLQVFLKEIQPSPNVNIKKNCQTLLMVAAKKQVSKL